MPARFLLHLADALLILHAGFALFILLGLVAIWLGARLGWGLARNRRLRIAHLAAMGFVALESLLGLACPLTEWESRLRTLAGADGYAGGFVAHWFGRLLYYDLDERVFLALYLLLFAAMAASWRLVPPRGRAPRAAKHSGPEK